MSCCDTANEPLLALKITKWINQDKYINKTISFLEVFLKFLTFSKKDAWSTCKNQTILKSPHVILKTFRCSPTCLLISFKLPVVKQHFQQLFEKLF